MEGTEAVVPSNSLEMLASVAWGTGSWGDLWIHSYDISWVEEISEEIQNLKNLWIDPEQYITKVGLKAVSYTHLTLPTNREV